MTRPRPQQEAPLPPDSPVATSASANLSTDTKSADMSPRAGSTSSQLSVCMIDAVESRIVTPWAFASSSTGPLSDPPCAASTSPHVPEAVPETIECAKFTPGTSPELSIGALGESPCAAATSEDMDVDLITTETATTPSHTGFGDSLLCEQEFDAFFDPPPSEEARNTDADPLPSDQALEALADAPPSTPVLTPSSTRPASPITLQNWNDRVKTSKDLRDKSGRIFRTTGQKMGHKSRTVRADASRGFERDFYVPTRKTVGRMPKRRYSFDVIVDYTARFEFDDAIMLGRKDHKENEPEVQYEVPLPLPDPLRHGFSKFRAQYVPDYDNGLYISLEGSRLSNKDFHHILCYEGSYSWMEDDILNTALEVLSIIENCHAHHISIVSTNDAQMYVALLMSGSGPQDGLTYREALENKRWIFVPINDAISDLVDTNTGKSSPTASGSHWSLVVVDRLYRVSYYYNSMTVTPESSSYKAAEVVNHGLLIILGEDPETWLWSPEYHSPCQFINNRFGEWQRGRYGEVWKSFDDGACGPFVWKMCSLLIEHIKTHQPWGQEDELTLSLPPLFSIFFEANFHSFDVRCDIQRVIERIRAIKDAIKDHDEAAIEGTDAVIDPGYPWLLTPTRAPVLQSQVETTVQTSNEQYDPTAFQDIEDAGISPMQTSTENGPYDEMTVDDDEDGGISIVNPGYDSDENWVIQRWQNDTELKY
jgi:hypothetical protein